MKKSGFFSFKNTTLPGRYIIAVTIIFAAGLTAISLVYRSAMIQNEKLIEDTFIKTAHSSLLTNAGTISTHLASPRSFTPEQIRARLDLIVKNNSSIITAVLYNRTPDENFFKAVYSVKPDLKFNIPIEKGVAVKQQNSSHYLKKGLARPEADPDIYSHEGIFWQNIYVPVRISGRTQVVQFFISADETVALFSAQKKQREKNAIITAAAVLFIITALAAAGGWFYYNFSHLITGLTHTVNRAASGDPEAKLNEKAADPSLAKLALSFNELVTEFQEARSLPRAALSPEGEPDTRELFALGVSFIKEARFEEAITVFKTITGIKPGSFAGFFNLGVACARSGMRSDALSFFEKARSLNPSHEKTQVYINRVRSSSADETGQA